MALITPLCHNPPTLLSLEPRASPIDFYRLKIDTTEPPIDEEVKLSSPANIHQPASGIKVISTTTVFIRSVPICVN